VHEDHHGIGLGASLLDAFEAEARQRSSTHVFVTSFTYQAPDFYRRPGYAEIFRWKDVPSRALTTSTCAKTCDPGLSPATGGAPFLRAGVWVG
jgi:N-acetylglutamate synthase-like GNAT family acetyltransferase